MAQTLTVIPGVPHPLVAGGPAAIVYRVSCDLAGSYASVADLDELSVPEGSVGDWGTATKERWLRVASRRLDSHVGQRWNVPLRAFSDAWVWAVCEVAFHGMCGKRGYRPGGDGEKTIDERYQDAVGWVKACQNYEVTPDPRLVLAEPARVAHMVSDLPRGWGGVTASDLLGGRRRRGTF